MNRPIAIAVAFFVLGLFAGWLVRGEGTPGADYWITGDAQVIDADIPASSGFDMLDLAFKVRLWGLHMAEQDALCSNEQGNQDCARLTYDALRGMIGKQPVSCHRREQSADGRHPLAICYAGDTEINHWLVINGWAIDWPCSSNGHYAALEKEARFNLRGLHRFTPDPFGKLISTGSECGGDKS